MLTVKKVEELLEKVGVNEGAWLGYPSEYGDNIYLCASGSEIKIAQSLRDFFENMSVKKAGKMIFTKKNGKLAVKLSKTLIIKGE
jgi:hypothetical protein